MKVRITGETIAAWDRVWLPPDGMRGKKLITVTGVRIDDDLSVTVFGVRKDTGGAVTVSGVFRAQPVDMEI